MSGPTIIIGCPVEHQVTNRESDGHNYHNHRCVCTPKVNNLSEPSSMDNVNYKILKELHYTMEGRCTHYIPAVDSDKI